MGPALRILLYFAFSVSGAAGLIYESIWSRYLGLFVGHSAYAQIIVLVIFMGGMALGALLVGRFSERIGQPLLWYAAVELAVAVFGLAFHGTYQVTTELAYDTLFPALSGGLLLIIVKWGLAALLILPQSVLLGATFPLMSAGVLRVTHQGSGRVLATLYFANSLGAAIGVLLAGFVLIAAVGLPGAVLCAASANIAAALVAYGIARSIPPPLPIDAQEAPLPERSRAPLRRLTIVLLGVSFGTAVASFIYEIVWIRMLSLVLGSATHAFELMLSAFILGLALGSFSIHRHADRSGDPVRLLGVVQWLMGFSALATLPLYATSFRWMAGLLSALAETELGYVLFSIARYGLCMSVMLPSTLCAGMTLPLITKILIDSRHREESIGQVYGLNTLGSILGVTLAGLLLLPVIGVRNALVLGALLDMTLGTAIFALLLTERSRRRRFLAASATATVLAVVVIVAGAPLNRLLMSSGVFRHGRLPDPRSVDLLFYEDGRTATISAMRQMREDETEAVWISSNGKSDASLPGSWWVDTGAEQSEGLSGDSATQVLLALFGLAHVPGAKAVAVIGQGSGISSHFILGSPWVSRLDTIEIEPAMVRGSRTAFYPHNRRVFDDPRSHFVYDDARAFFAATDRRYDFILSEPSNPWVSGVSDLFTREFYARVRTRLDERGVFVQWIHAYESSDAMVLSVLAALAEYFPDFAIYQSDPTDLVIVATTADALSEADWSVFRFPGVAADLSRFPPVVESQLPVLRILDKETLDPLLSRWKAPNSDFFPIVDLQGERLRYFQSNAAGFVAMGTDRIILPSPLLGRKPFAPLGGAPSIMHPRLIRRAVSSFLRGAPVGDDRRSLAKGTGVPGARHAYWRLYRILDESDPPPDWRVWLRDVLEVEHVIHAGTEGVYDRRFYDAVQEYLDRHAAPEEARLVIDFYRGWSSWDFAGLATTVDGLLPGAVAGEDWINAVDLCNGGVLANLVIGNAAAARRVFEQMENRLSLRRGDLRLRLLEAYAEQADELVAHPRFRVLSDLGAR